MVMICGHLKSFITSQNLSISLKLVKNVLVELNHYLTYEEKVLTTNMLVHLAKINGDVDPGEIDFFNYVKRSWEIV